MNCSKRRAPHAIISKAAAALAIRLFHALDQPSTVQALWEGAGQVARGPYYLRFSDEIVVNHTSDVFNVAIALLIGEGHVRVRRRVEAWEIVRVGRTLLDALVLAAVEDDALTVPTLQARLGHWTRGTDTVFDQGTLATIDGVSPCFAKLLQGMFSAGLVRTFWGPRSIRIARAPKTGDRSGEWMCETHDLS